MAIGRGTNYGYPLCACSVKFVLLDEKLKTEG